MPVSTDPSDASAAESSENTGYERLISELSHDFNSIWARIFGAAQTAENAGTQRISSDTMELLCNSSNSGLLYSRTLIHALGYTRGYREFDACDVVRTWAQQANSALNGNIDLSCTVPAEPLHIRFDPCELTLVLLAFVGYALHAESPSWAAIGVRQAGTGTSRRSVDILLSLSMRKENSNVLPNLQRRISLVKALLEPVEGSIFNSIVPGVGVNLRLSFPVASD